MAPQTRSAAAKRRKTGDGTYVEGIALSANSAFENRKLLGDGAKDRCPLSMADGPASASDKADKGKSRAVREEPYFPQFSQLPAEIRLLIWHKWRDMCEQPIHPLRVRLYRGQQRAKRSACSRPLRLTAMPDLSAATQVRRTVLRVCREARYEFLRFWSSVLTLDRGGILRFNAERDIVYLDIVNTRVIQDLVDMRLAGDVPDFVKKIGHLGFDMAPRLPHWFDDSREWLDPRLDFILCFPNLHSISLVSFDSFASEVHWDDRDDVGWLLSRARNHRVEFCTFPALDGIDYTQPCQRGKRVGGGMERHDCVICTIHKCVYVRDFLQNAQPDVVSRPKLTEDENRWLADLAYYTLLVSMPNMTRQLHSIEDKLLGDEEGREARRGGRRPRLAADSAGVLDDDEYDSELEFDTDGPGWAATTSAYGY